MIPKSILDDQPTSNLLIRKEKKHNLFVFKIQANILKIVRTLFLSILFLIIILSIVYIGVTF